jgi:hypothetical protein
MRSKESIQMIVEEFPSQSGETSSLEDGIEAGIGDDLLLDAIATFAAGVHEMVGRDTRGEIFDPAGRMALFL